MHNTYIPKAIKIEHVFQETPDTKTIYLRHFLDFSPGQFVEISCFGIGEAPISLASGPDEELLRISFKCVGSVTRGLFNLKNKDYIGIRGPFGNGFPVDHPGIEELIFIAGGIGLAPLRALLKFILYRKQDKLKNIILLYGARSPQDLLYKKELNHWAKSIKVSLTVDKPDAGWKGRVGVVTALLNEIRIKPSQTKAFICGPEIMMRFTTEKLIKAGMDPADIILSLERYMKCGIGKCGHCYLADKFVCRDGPIFTYEQLNTLRPSLEVL